MRLQVGCIELSDQRGSRAGAVISSVNEPKITSEAAQPVPLFQLLARGDPARGDDVRAVSAVAAERRRPTVRTWDRHMS